MSTISQSCCVEEVSLLYTGSWKVGVSSGMFIAGGVSQPLPQDGGGVAGEGVSSDMYTAAGASQSLGGGGRAAGEYCRPALSCKLQLGLSSPCFHGAVDL